MSELFRLQGKRVWVAGHRGMAGAAIVRRLREEDCEIVTAGREELDLFIDAMKSIAIEAEQNPELVKTAPHNTRIGRLDEAAAARKPMLRWKPAKTSSAAGSE